MRIIGDGGHAKVVQSVIMAEHGIWPDAIYAFIAVGNNMDRATLARIHDEYKFPVLRHPFSWVDATAQIGDGSIIMAGVVIQAHAKIGKHCIVNTGASLDHDVVLADYVHIAPGAHLCGAVTVGEGALVGVGVGVAPGAVIPAWSVCKAAKLDIEEAK